ncbi:MAG: gamma-glutamyl-gamma-aminobutyrate hydrolase family protein, partial [Candidatus Saccharimonadales bacterium]
YSKTIAAVGAVPIILTPDTQMEYIKEHCDGIIITGGQDLNPSLYGQIAHPNLGFQEPIARFEWEQRLISACDEQSIPILGICYGMQALNIYYGGTLYQDIPSCVPDSVGHLRVTHDITFHTDFLGMKSAAVHQISSRHHQAVDKLADGFMVTANAPDGIVEAIEGHGHYGIQWHPESDETGIHMYRSFVEECLGVPEEARVIDTYL